MKKLFRSKKSEGLPNGPNYVNTTSEGFIITSNGQWEFPGQNTLIPSNNITMKGVPYPVFGMDDTGYSQMMYPGAEYTFPGDMVYEMPMMQSGGSFNPETDEFIGFVDELPKAQFGIQKMYPDATSVNINLPQIDPKDKFIIQKNNSNIPKPTRSPFEELQYLDSQAQSNYFDTISKLDSWPKLSGKTINLTTDRYRGAKVPIEYINMLTESANRFKIDPYLLYAIAGRESTFGQGSDLSKERASTPINLISGWNLTESYEPYSSDRFLADNKTPKITVHKGKNQYIYDIDFDEINNNLNTINEYITKNNLVDKYKTKLSKTKKINYTNPFDFLAEFIINKGIEKYNPGDPDYRNKINNEIRLLKMDPEFSKYVNQKSKGGLVKAQVGKQTYANKQGVIMGPIKNSDGSYTLPVSSKGLPQVNLPEFETIGYEGIDENTDKLLKLWANYNSLYNESFDDPVINNRYNKIKSLYKASGNPKLDASLPAPRYMAKNSYNFLYSGDESNPKKDSIINSYIDKYSKDKSYMDRSIDPKSNKLLDKLNFLATVILPPNMYSPLFNEVNYIANNSIGEETDRLVEELSHAYQQNRLNKNVAKAWINEQLNNPIFGINSYHNKYIDPKSFEYEAHSIIAPKMYDYLNGKISLEDMHNSLNYLNQKAKGGLVRAQEGKENKLRRRNQSLEDDVLLGPTLNPVDIEYNAGLGNYGYGPTARKFIPSETGWIQNPNWRGGDALEYVPLEALLTAPAARLALTKYGPSIGKALMSGMSRSLPGLSSIPGATYGNLLGSIGAVDAMTNRLPQIPGQLSRGEYADAATNALMGGLDLYGANMISPLSKGAGTLFREQIYKAVDPHGYGVREKILRAPQTWVRNTFNPSARPERIGNQFNPWGAYSKDEVIQLGKNRLDAFRLGLNLEQDYNTFRNLGNNTYRINAMKPKEDLFNDLYSDILASEQSNRGFYLGEDPLITIANRNLAAKARIGISDPSVRADYYRYIGNQNTPWQQTRIVERAKNPQFRNSIYDTDTQAIMGSYRWDVNKLNDGNIHFQSNDTWNLNPWENRGQVNLAQDTKSPNYRKWNPFSNLEFLSLVGGKPFNIQNNFIVDPKTYRIIDSYKKGGSNLPSYQKKGQVTPKYLSPEQLGNREVMQPDSTATDVPNISRVKRDPIERPDIYSEIEKKYQADIEAEKQRQLAYRNRSGIISGVKVSNPEASAQEMAKRKVAWDNQPLDEKAENYATETVLGVLPELAPFLNTGRKGYKIMNQLVDEVPTSRVSSSLNLERPIRDGSRNKSTLFKKRVNVDDENFKIDIGYRGRRESDKIIPKEINIKGKSGKWNISRNNDDTFSFHAAMSSPIESGKALKKLDELLPPKPVIHDQGSLSLDSYPLLLNMARRSHWSPEFAGYTMLNRQHKHSNLFKGLEPEKSFLDMLESNTIYTFKDKTKANEAITRINELLKSKGFKEKAEIIENNETLSDLIKKTYSIKLPNYKFTRNYKQGGTYNPNTDEFLGFID